MHRVKELCGAGGFYGKLYKAYKERCKRSNTPCLPAGTKHILLTEIQNEEHARHRNDAVDRRHGSVPDVRFHGCFFIARQVFFVYGLTLFFKTENAVGHSVFCTVQSSGAQSAGLLLVRRAGFLNDFFHLFRRNIRDRREKHAQNSQTPIIPQQHAEVCCQRHAGVENLGREFAHALHAVVYVKNGLRHDIAFAFFAQTCTAFFHKAAVQSFFHAAIHIVCKAAYVKALHVA